MTIPKTALALTCALGLVACEETTTTAAPTQGSGQIVVRSDGSIVDPNPNGAPVVLPDGGIIVEQAGAPPAPQGGQSVQQASAPTPPAPRQAGGRQNCARVLGYTVANGQRLAMIDTGQNTFFTPFDTIPNNPNVCPFDEAELDRIQL